MVNNKHLADIAEVHKMIITCHPGQIGCYECAQKQAIDPFFLPPLPDTKPSQFQTPHTHGLPLFQDS